MPDFSKEKLVRVLPCYYMCAPVASVKKQTNDQTLYKRNFSPGVFFVHLFVHPVSWLVSATLKKSEKKSRKKTNANCPPKSLVVQHACMLWS